MEYLGLSMDSVIQRVVSVATEMGAQKSQVYGIRQRVQNGPSTWNEQMDSYQQHNPAPGIYHDHRV